MLHRYYFKKEQYSTFIFFVSSNTFKTYLPFKIVRYFRERLTSLTCCPHSKRSLQSSAERWVGDGSRGWFDCWCHHLWRSSSPVVVGTLWSYQKLVYHYGHHKRSLINVKAVIEQIYTSFSLIRVSCSRHCFIDWIWLNFEI